MKKSSILLSIVSIAILSSGCATKSSSRYVHDKNKIVVLCSQEDDDRDGVVNSVDECPNTPFGVDVNEVGCFVDGDDDNDGVLNSIDECPNTSAGATVDTKGCFVDGDDDNDGVFNSMDKCPNTKAGASVDEVGCMIDRDDDNDGVYNSIDECPNTPLNAVVDKTGCSVGDDDNDGVINSVDKCPNTPINVRKVDRDGCMQEVNLNINFENKSYNVDDESMQHIKEFVEFLKANPSYKVDIIGYTDSRGKVRDNLLLSKRRAAAVKNIIIDNGIDPTRVVAIGRGESNPIATNSTAQGRAQNRRIEAKLIKN
jgi:outer membrane protein OmpA-like peptidoglycan-associated protein